MKKVFATLLLAGALIQPAYANGTGDNSEDQLAAAILAGADPTQAANAAAAGGPGTGKSVGKGQGKGKGLVFAPGQTGAGFRALPWGPKPVSPK